jgi:hypothetical protein
MEPGHSPRRASLLAAECCVTTASRPNSVPGPNSLDPGTSRWEPRDDQAARAASLRGCQTPFHRSVVSARTRSEMAHDEDQQSRDPSDPVEIWPFLTAVSTTCCSFEMIRASFPTGVGKKGVFALYITQGTQRASDYEQGQLIGVRSGVNARAVAAAYQPSRPAYRRESRPGSGQSATLTALSPSSPSTTGHRRHRIVCPITVRVQISRAASVCSCNCAISPNGREAYNPYIGTTPGRNDSRCAGITK